MSVTDTDRLLFDVQDMVATITLNFPEKLNAFNTEMLHAWAARLAECRDREDVRVIVVTGAGRGFCSGGDTGGMGANDKSSPRDAKENLQNNIHPIALTLQTIDKPVICALNGVAAGAGLDMALHCDIRYAAASARFAETYTRVGLVPGNGAAWTLPRTVGVQRALEMLWTADFVNAQQAKEIGLVNQVLPADQLLPQVMEVAAGLAEKSQLIMGLAMKAVGLGLDMSLQVGCGLEAALFGVAGSSEDASEGCGAFLEKRKAEFKDR